MSQETVEIVRKIFEAIAARQPPAPELVSPEVEFIPYLANVDGQVYRGIEGVTSWLDEMDTAFEEVRPQLRSVRALDDRHVLTLGQTLLRGKGSGAAINFEWAQLIQVEDGRVTSIRIFRGEPEALEAAGLSE